jgi:pilus assembly protein Flp/PilA
MTVALALMNWLSGLRGEDGQGMVEYGLIIALIAVVVIAVLTALGKQVGTMFCSVLTGLGGTCP